MIRIRRALITVSDKSQVGELAKALAESGAEIVATGRTASVLEESGVQVVPIEKVSGSPEAFQGRMKTLSFPVCSGILYRRGDAKDESDLSRLSIRPIDCVVVNFYPFEKAAAREGVTRDELIEEIDIGGPTLVRAAAKNAPDTLVLTSPAQYAEVIRDLKAQGGVNEALSERCALQAWKRIRDYDQAIESTLSGRKKKLRYGENPHQEGWIESEPGSPIAWNESLTPSELSYNNILDLTAAYGLASDLREISPECSSVVIVKHNNACGVASVPWKAYPSAGEAQLAALQRAWDGDPVSAFGGVLVFTDELQSPAASWLSERFVELVAAPSLKPATEGGALATVLARRKNLKAVRIERFGESPKMSEIPVPGGKLIQSTDLGLDEALKSVTKKAFPSGAERLARFGIAVCRSLKSNAVALVREIPGMPGALQLVGAGQGQPNRVEALKQLAVPRARAVVGELQDCILVSDAFFPFRDTVDTAYEAGIRTIIQPGGSLKDADSIAACDEHGMSMAFTGRRHFRH